MNVIVEPPLKVYPSPGTWSVSLINTRRTSCTLILEPFAALIVISDPESLSENATVLPSKRSSRLSSTCRVPSDQAVNSSVNTF